MNKFAERMKREIEEKRCRDVILGENAFRRGRVQKSKNNGQEREKRNMKTSPGRRRNKGLLKVRIGRIVKKNWQRLEICALDESERGG